MKRTRFWLVVVFAAPVGFLLALEALLWGLDLGGASGEPRSSPFRHSANPEIGYELTPGAYMKGILTEIRVNSEGRRGPEPRPGPARRLAVVGDSVAFGIPLPEQDSFPAQLRDILGPAWRVENYGVPGYRLAHVIGTVEGRVGPTRPEAVVYAFCLNDLIIFDIDPEKWRRVNRLHARVSFPWRTWHLGVDLAAVISRSFAFFGMNAEPEFLRTIGDRIDPVDDPSPELEAAMAAAETDHFELRDAWTRPSRVGHLRWGLRRFEALSREYGFRALLFVVPFFENEQGHYPYAPIHRIVALEAQAAGLELLDPVKRLMDRDLDALRALSGDPVHPGPEGHAVLADELARWVEALEDEPFKRSIEVR